MVNLLIPALFGLLGGLLRAIVGFLKHYRISNKTKFKTTYFILTLIFSALIGMIISTALSANYLVNLIAGYAGIDILENFMKIIKKKN